jgi:lipopolysaccharide biosynthesis glycosyltransferase
MKETAVEWLFEQISVCRDFTEEELLKKAKEMEKQQIEDAFNKGFSTTSWNKAKENKATEYYNENFKK